MIEDFAAGGAVPTHADVCIVGAGTVGILLALELASRGLTITLLEGGGEFLEHSSQEIYRCEQAGKRLRGAEAGRFRVFGGSTTEWGGQVLELGTPIFEDREWLPGSKWPFPKQELAPFYERALVFQGLRRVKREDEDVWRLLDLDALDLGPTLHVSFSRWLPDRNFATLYGAVIKTSEKITCLLHANLTGLETSASGSEVIAAEIKTLDGRSAQVRANRFVLCLGGIETSRLLLQPSREGSRPWLQNSLLGKHFQDHISVNQIPISLTKPEWAQKVFDYTFAAGYKYHCKLHLAPEIQQERKLLDVGGTIGPMGKNTDRREIAMRNLRRLRSSPKGSLSLSEKAQALSAAPSAIASRIASRMRSREEPWKAAMLTVHCEQLPETKSSISLVDATDELGMRRARIDWRIDPEEIRTVREYATLAGETLKDRGIGAVSPPAGFYEDDAVIEQLATDSYHHMGGTRMGSSAATGVVDEHLRVHGVDNLFICSSSVFPSTGYSNPTHTLLALGMRLSDHLAAQAGASVKVQVAGKPPSPPLAKVQLGRAGVQVPQLMYGCAYLLGPGIDWMKSRRLLEAAYDAGIRHFDTAKMYGQGEGEVLLGEFLRSHPDATVTTKYGLFAPSVQRRAVGAIARRVPGMRSRFQPQPRKAAFTYEDAQRTLEDSLRKLKRDRVDLLLLHEPEPADLNPNILLFLQNQQAKGTIGDFGVGGERARLPALLAAHQDLCPVTQYDATALGAELPTGAGFEIHYRAFAPAAAAISKLFKEQPALVATWSEQVGIDLSERANLTRVLLRAALDRWPAAGLLFSTSSEDHIFEAAETAADATLSQPASLLLVLYASHAHSQPRTSA